ncbi:MAG: IS5 family transposase, partial [Gammaproteobacteria bacterium]
MTVRHGLTNSEWFEIEHLLPGNKSDPGVTAANNRLFVDAILYRYRTGVPWRDLPPHFGDFRVIHTRFMRWARNGIWENIFRVLSIDTDTEYAMIDSTINRAHQHSSGAKNSSKKSECIGKS